MVLKRVIFDKTGGRCHICGRVLKFDAKRGERGRWSIDHIVPRARGGKEKEENFLPACRFCNGKKWHHKGRAMRIILHLGAVAWHENKLKSVLGKQIWKKLSEDIKMARKRRKGKLPDEYYK